MKVIHKLEGAIDRGMVALDEAILLIRVARETLGELQPTLAALPGLLRAVTELVAAQRALVGAKLDRARE